MRSQLLTLIFSSALIAGCTKQESSQPSGSAAGPAAGAPEAPAIPTPEEAAAEAAKTIDQSNADQEFDKLLKEIEGG
jgi:hypothetical protein